VQFGNAAIHCTALVEVSPLSQNSRNQSEYLTYWELEVLLWLEYYMIVYRANVIFGWIYVLALDFNILKYDEKYYRNVLCCERWVWNEIAIWLWSNVWEMFEEYCIELRFHDVLERIWKEQDADWTWYNLEVI
jgi:hypothetical protein